METIHHRNARIGIIGAGAAGLSAAAYLADSGYRNVTVLEKDFAPGGKCRSHRSHGYAWELGAVLGTTDYEATLDLMARVGMAPYRFSDLPRKPSETDDSFIDEGLWPMEKLFPGWIGADELPGAFSQMARYHALSLKWKSVYDCGHLGVPLELGENFSSWAERYSMNTLAKLFAIPFTTFGYGYYEDVPAAYVLKYFEPGIVRSLVMHQKFFNWDGGVQTLWERLAFKHDVKYGARIVSISRPAVSGKGSVSVRLADGSSFEFDKLIIACPVDEAWELMGPEAEERALSAPLRHNDYFVYVCRVDGLKVPAGFAPARFEKGSEGLPMIWDERYRGTGVHTFYCLGDGKQGPSEIEAGIEKDVALMGGRMRETLASARWKYFPHVDPDAYRSGYYERLESLQGRRGVYLTGELLGFSTIECSVRYSRDLVKRFFA